MTDADRLEYLTNQLQYYKELSLRLHHQLMASKNIPEKDTTRGLHRDPVGNKVARKIDRERGI
ncbi:hypothetical protein ASF64_17605 [Arthrobacter sp. Leaf137]|nr:hypothetical protein ASF64_17605 [Arthrobacter sp. Leaf137]